MLRFAAKAGVVTERVTNAMRNISSFFISRWCYGSGLTGLMMPGVCAVIVTTVFAVELEGLLATGSN